MKKVALFLMGLIPVLALGATVWNYFPPPNMTYDSVNGIITLNSSSTAIGGLVFSGAQASTSTQPLVPALAPASQAGNPSFLVEAVGTSGAPTATCKFNGCLTDTGVGDLTYESTYTQPTWGLIMSNNTAQNEASMFAQSAAGGQVAAFGVDTDASTSCVDQSSNSPLPAPVTNNQWCAFITLLPSSTKNPIFIIDYGTTTGTARTFVDFEPNAGFLATGLTTPSKYLQWSSTGTSQATVTVGDTNVGSVTNIVGGSGANTRANGQPILTGLGGTSVSIGGGALIAGVCASGTATVTGATVGQVAVASALTSGAPGDAFYRQADVTAVNTVTVKICAAIAGTPTASLYTIRVIQ